MNLGIGSRIAVDDEVEGFDFRRKRFEGPLAVVRSVTQDVVIVFRRSAQSCEWEFVMVIKSLGLLSVTGLDADFGFESRPADHRTFVGDVLDVRSESNGILCMNLRQ